MKAALFASLLFAASGSAGHVHRAVADNLRRGMAPHQKRFKLRMDNPPCESCRNTKNTDGHCYNRTCDDFRGHAIERQRAADRDRLEAVRRRAESRAIAAAMGTGTVQPAAA